MSGGEKTEKATARKKSDARKRGQVMKSTDLSSSLQILVFVLAIGLMLGWMSHAIKSLLVTAYEDWIPQGESLTILMTQLAYRQSVFLMIKALVPVMGLALVLAVGVNLAQTRFLVSTEALAVKPERINPLEGFKRLFSSRSVAELVKALLKIIILIAAVYPVLKTNLLRLCFLLANDLATATRTIFDLIEEIALRSALVLLGIAVVDLVYQWWRFEKDLMMSKEEVKEEFKQMEGNPQTRSRIRQIQRQMAARRMMQAVPEATVVITNPTHFAVALRYEAGKDKAPVVVAKGKDLVAQRIKAVAREHRVTLVENRPLARMLFASSELGHAIPADLYGAVAEVLAYVTRLKEGHRA